MKLFNIIGLALLATVIVSVGCSKTTRVTAKDHDGGMSAYDGGEGKRMPAAHSAYDGGGFFLSTADGGSGDGDDFGTLSFRPRIHRSGGRFVLNMDGGSWRVYLGHAADGGEMATDAGVPHDSAR
jgi:hypothetical protein